jgi:hypothetical protein
MKEREMRLCSSFLCFGFCGFIAVHFWAPTFKWGISIANVADFSKPPEKLSYPQQLGMKRLHLKILYTSFYVVRF